MKDQVAKVEKARALIADLKDEIKRADSSLGPPDVSKQRVETYVRRLAQQFEELLSPHYFLLRDFKGDFRLTHEPLIDQMAAWLLGDAMIDIIQRRVDEARRGMSDRETLDDSAVASVKADLKRRLFDAEVAEERAVCEAELAGALIVRRRDADPRAILAA